MPTDRNAPIPFPVVEDRIYIVNGHRYLVLNLRQLDQLRREAPHLIVVGIGDNEPCVDIGPERP